MGYRARSSFVTARPLDGKQGLSLAASHQDTIRHFTRLAVDPTGEGWASGLCPPIARRQLELLGARHPPGPNSAPIPPTRDAYQPPGRPPTGLSLAPRAFASGGRRRRASFTGRAVRGRPAGSSSVLRSTGGQSGCGPKNPVLPARERCVGSSRLSATARPASTRWTLDGEGLRTPSRADRRGGREQPCDPPARWAAGRERCGLPKHLPGSAARWSTSRSRSSTGPSRLYSGTTGRGWARPTNAA